MNESKNAILTVEREGEMMVFIGEDPNLSYSIGSTDEEYNINIFYNSRNIDPVVAFIARRTNNTVTLTKVILTDSNELVMEPVPFGVGQYQFHKDGNERLIHNGTYYTQRIVE